MQDESGTVTERLGNAFSDLKSKLRIDTALAKLSGSKEYLIEAVFFAGIGFVSGYFIKRFSAAAVVVILTLAGLAVLQHFGFVEIMVKWGNLQELLGVDPALLVGDNFLTILWTWFKTHLLLGISFVVAFLLGIRCA
jgi:uncharacterized membrane protein (Fun14 family)